MNAVHELQANAVGFLEARDGRPSMYILCTVQNVVQAAALSDYAGDGLD